MKTLITIALMSIYGLAWAQTTTTNPSVPTTTTGSTTTVPTINLPPTNTMQNSTSQSNSSTQTSTADRIREENRITQQQTQQALQQQNSRGVTPRSTSVCIQNDTRCLAEEARNRINQNNGTVRDNPTDLNNRPTY